MRIVNGNFEWTNKYKTRVKFVKKQDGRFTYYTLVWWQRLLVWLRIMKDPIKIPNSSKNNNDKLESSISFSETTPESYNSTKKWLIENDEVGQMESVKLEGKIEIQPTIRYIDPQYNPTVKHMTVDEIIMEYGNILSEEEIANLRKNETNNPQPNN